MKISNKKDNFVISLMKRTFRFLFFSVRRAYASIAFMSKTERLVCGIALLTAFVLMGIKFSNIYIDSTKTVPSYGGTYKEAVFGDIKYLNPLLASSDLDASISRLIFDPLLEVDKDGNIKPVIADSWSISDDKLSYTVVLKNNIYFHDQKKLTSEDVVYTLEQVKDPNFQSPLYEAWKDVQIEAIEENKVVFTLPKVYGPFVYYLEVGIVPSHVSADELTKSFVGTGPYKYESTKKSKEKVSELFLESNKEHFEGRPYIDRVQFSFFDQKINATKSFDSGIASGVGGLPLSVSDVNDLTFETSKKLALIPNLRIEKFADKDFRTKVLSGDFIFEEKTKIALTTLDLPIQRAKAEEIKQNFSNRNIDLDLRFMNPNQMKEVLDEKKYELLLYGFDFSHDPDLYVFWHSSQLSKLNFSGYSDKKSDLLLEEARMTIDDHARKEKYTQFFALIEVEKLAIFYEPIQYNFYTNKKIKGTKLISGVKAASRFSEISKWYIEEKRVRK